VTKFCRLDWLIKSWRSQQHHRFNYDNTLCAKEKFRVDFVHNNMEKSILTLVHINYLLRLSWKIAGTFSSSYRVCDISPDTLQYLAQVSVFLLGVKLPHHFIAFFLTSNLLEGWVYNRIKGTVLDMSYQESFATFTSIYMYTDTRFFRFRFFPICFPQSLIIGYFIPVGFWNFSWISRRDSLVLILFGASFTLEWSTVSWIFFALP